MGPRPCPRCGSIDTDMGYGLAGGGIGSYLYCDQCGEILEKWQEDEGDEPTPEQHADAQDE